ncbi:GGDEF domain-containing protein [Pseudoalteromonas sp. KAN5]|uniref:GGDEF domain-containing protein n=1 Tax=Pseudoalteromonas sp. KAN5 TaxID=2916633 RepID=UPI001FCA58C0|nr:GGDEF domain-containing protein [Pseudoalteromonas sp. KAN5]
MINFQSIFLFVLLMYGGELFANTTAQDKQQLEHYYTKFKADIDADNMLHVMSYIHQLRQLAVSQQALEIEVESYLFEAMVKRRYGAFEEGVKLNNYALELAQSAGNKKYTAWAYLHLAHLEMELERFRLAQQYIHHAIDYYKSDNSEYTTLMYLWQSKIYLAMGSYHQALAASNKAQSVTANIGDTMYEVAVNHAQILLKLGNYQAAQTMLANVDPTQISKSQERVRLQYYLALANCYLQAGNFKLAIHTALSQLANSYNTRFLEEQAQLQFLVASAYRQQKEFKLAYRYLNRYSLSKDALSLQRRNNKVLQLEAHFKFDSQNQQLLLLSKDNALKEQRLLQQQQTIENHHLQQQRWLLAGILIMCGLAFIYWRWQNQRYLVTLKQQVAERTHALAKSNELLKTMSYTDSLTGLHNRHYFFSVINQQLAKLARANHLLPPAQLQNLVFAVVDIDHFKQINDSHGHGAGDQVLEQFSKILQQHSRDSDLLIRWGGEEFLLVMDNLTFNEAAHTLNRVRNAVADHQFTLNHDESLQCTCSVGFASYPFIAAMPELFNWEQVIELADGALYLAKENQRNAWVGIAPSTEKTHWQSDDVVKHYRKYLLAGELQSYSNITAKLKF